MLPNQNRQDEPQFSRFILNPPARNIAQISEQLLWKSVKFYYKIVHFKGQEIMFEIVIQDLDKKKSFFEGIIQITSEQEFSQTIKRIFDKHFSQSFRDCHFFTFKAIANIQIQNQSSLVQYPCDFQNKTQSISKSLINSKNNQKDSKYEKKIDNESHYSQYMPITPIHHSNHQIKNYEELEQQNRLINSKQFIESYHQLQNTLKIHREKEQQIMDQLQKHYQRVMDQQVSQDSHQKSSTSNSSGLSQLAKKLNSNCFI